MLKKLIAISLALVLCFGLVAGAGCGESLPQEEIDQIVIGAMAAGYGTVSFDTEMPMTVEIKGGDDPGTIVVSMSGTGFLDMVNEAMRMASDIDLSVAGTGSRYWETEVYVVDGWIYSGVSVPDEGEEWLKTELTGEIWQQQNPLTPYLELLATASDIDYKGTEIVNGVECYLFELEPDIELLSILVAESTASLPATNLIGLDLPELYRDYSVKEWVAKDSYLLQRAEIEMSFEIRPEDVGGTEDSFDKFTIDFGLTMRYYDYNQPFTVVLPPEALDAEEFDPEATDS